LVESADNYVDLGRTLKYLFVFYLVLCGCMSKKSLNLTGEIEFNLEDTLLETLNEDKKLLIYFSSFGCAGCRSMEENILNHKDVIEAVNENYNIVTLYTDDRLKINNNKNIKNHLGMEIVYNGALNSYYQIKLTRNGTQPEFAIVEKDSFTDITIEYTNDRNDFVNFLITNK